MNGARERWQARKAADLTPRRSALRLLIFAIRKSPQFIKLYTSAFQVAKHAVLIVGTNFSDFSKEAHYGFLRSACYADSGTNRAAFNEVANNVGASLKI